MSDPVEAAVADLEENTRVAREEFASLSADQVNWKPAPDRWSVAQCLDHLIRSNGLYRGAFEALREAPPKPSFWQRWSPLSGFFGKMLVRSLAPGAGPKAKTSPNAEPSASRIDAGIVEQFAAHHEELIGQLRSLRGRVDPDRVILTSPFVSFVTYSLADTFRIIVIHERRHFEQARRVMADPAFPGSPPAVT